MSNQGKEKCPLCMEVMDQTDQQLKPCQCRYEICVWCWHNIMTMAEKDDKDGLCPACRAPYDKDRILGKAISIERVGQLNSKKHKLQKETLRLVDVQKDLSTVRVIRRDLVYIVGIPVNIADEEILKKKEYLGQYGKIVKVLIGKVGANQHFPDSCCVYVTFSKEVEALRCIQAINGYILCGRPLKASFGTTRYCRALLSNKPCRNANCLYVHSLVKQEDIYTRHEVAVVSASKVQQSSGTASNSYRQRSGSTLPPPIPISDCCGSSSITKGTSLQSLDHGSRSSGKVLQNGDAKKSAPQSVAASWIRDPTLSSGWSSFDASAVTTGPIYNSSMPSNYSLSSTVIGGQTSVQPGQAAPIIKQALVSGDTMRPSKDLPEGILLPESRSEDGLSERTVPDLNACFGDDVVVNNPASELSYLTYIDDLADRMVEFLYSSGSDKFNQQVSVPSPTIPIQCLTVEPAPSCISDSYAVRSDSETNWFSECLEKTKKETVQNNMTSRSSSLIHQGATVWGTTHPLDCSRSDEFIQQVSSLYLSDSIHHTRVKSSVPSAVILNSITNRTNQESESWDSITDTYISAEEYCMISTQPSSNLKAATVNQLPRATSASNMPLSDDWSDDCLDSKLINSSKFNGKRTLFCYDNWNSKVTYTSNACSTATARSISKFSSYSSVCVEPCKGEQGIFHNDPFCMTEACQDMDHFTDENISLEKYVQDAVILDETNVDSGDINSISIKQHADSRREDSVLSASFSRVVMLPQSRNTPQLRPSPGFPKRAIEQQGSSADLTNSGSIAPYEFLGSSLPVISGGGISRSNNFNDRTLTFSRGKPPQSTKVFHGKFNIPSDSCSENDKPFQFGSEEGYPSAPSVI
ncbi:uncharacterized protein [Typha latifolia]|uniref:uncharacterized protein isoform X2 n=1 Tax=Typha latifolia TaxID=4733 RepID=UPI003C2BBBE9